MWFLSSVWCQCYKTFGIEIYALENQARVFELTNPYIEAQQGAPLGFSHKEITGVPKFSRMKCTSYLYTVPQKVL